MCHKTKPNQTKLNQTLSLSLSLSLARARALPFLLLKLGLVFWSRLADLFVSPNSREFYFSFSGTDSVMYIIPFGRIVKLQSLAQVDHLSLAQIDHLSFALVGHLSFALVGHQLCLWFFMSHWVFPLFTIFSHQPFKKNICADHNLY